MPISSSPPSLAPKTPTPLKGIQKAAILMVILKEEASAEVLKQLDEGEVQRIGREIARIPAITSEMAESVLAEFYDMILAQNYVLKGGIDYARKILTVAFGSEQARNLIERLANSLSVDPANFDALQAADPQMLANLIQIEHPQTIGLILSHLGPTQSARLLSYLPLDLRPEVVLRMANLDHISPEIVTKIALIVGDTLKALGETHRETYGGTRAVAEMFNQLDQNDGKAIMEKMRSSDPEVCEAIRQLMFVFEDILKIDQAGIRALLERVDRKVLSISLKGTSDALKNHFLDVMSKRGAEMMREDMNALGPIKMREVEKAQQEIISAARELEAEGALYLRTANEEQYVS